MGKHRIVTLQQNSLGTSPLPYDPESTASTGTWYQGIDFFRQPSCRNMGFSVNLTF